MPIGLTSQIEPSLDGVVHTRSRFVWLACQHHSRILHAFAPLAVIAGLTAGDDICPLVLTATAARHDVIDREVFIHAAAVLARKSISNEYLSPRELDAGTWPTHKCPQSNDRGHLKCLATCVEELLALLQHIGLAPKYEHKRTSNVAHVQWFIVLVEHQYGVVHPAEPFGSGLPWFTFAPGTECNRCDFSEGDSSKGSAQLPR